MEENVSASLVSHTIPHDNTNSAPPTDLVTHDSKEITLLVKEVLLESEKLHNLQATVNKTESLSSEITSGEHDSICSTEGQAKIIEATNFQDSKNAGNDISADVPASTQSLVSCTELPSELAVEEIDHSTISVKGERADHTTAQSFDQMQSVVESESDSDSSTSDDELLIERPHIDGEVNEEGVPLGKGNENIHGPLVPGELTVSDLPPLADLTIDIGKEVVLSELGSVLNILDCLVIIKANPRTPALDEDTVLFFEDRRSAGKVFETFGPVVSPFYSIRFNCTGDITNARLSVGDKIFFADTEEKLTNYVFVDRLKKEKGSDASWAKNHEPPSKSLDYSDDEQERKAKAKSRTKDKTEKQHAEVDTVQDGCSSKRIRTHQHTPSTPSTSSTSSTSHGGNTPRFTQPTWRHPSPQGYPPHANFRHPPPTWAGNGSYGPPHPSYYPPNYPQAPAAFGAPPMMSGWWQHYGSTWSNKDSSFYSEADKPAPTFVDTRFVQHQPSASNDT